MNKNIFLSLLLLNIIFFNVSCSKSVDDLKVSSNSVNKQGQIKGDTSEEENEDPGQLYQKGLVFLNNNDIDRAEKYLLLAISKNPKYFMGYNLLAQYYSRHKHFKTSMEYYNKALEYYPKCHIAYAGIGEVYFMQKNYDKAIESMEKALELKPDYKKLYPALTKIYIKNNNKKAAIETLKKYNTKFPDDPKDIDVLINLYSKAQ